MGKEKVNKFLKQSPLPSSFHLPGCILHLSKMAFLPPKVKYFPPSHLALRQHFLSWPQVRGVSWVLEPSKIIDSSTTTKTITWP